MDMYNPTLIERLGLHESFNALEPSTLQGKVIYEKYGKMLEASESVTHFHNFMLECLGSNDLVLRNWAQVTSNNISVTDPNGWKFNVIMERLEHSGVGINEMTVDQLNYLRFYDENRLTEAISQGAFKNNMHIGALKEMYESITGDIKARKLSEGHVRFTPISYVEIKEGKKYFTLGNKIFEDSATGVVAVDAAPSQAFANANAAIDAIPYNPEVDEFELDFLPGAVNVNTFGEINKDKEPWTVQQVHDMVNQELEQDSLSDQQKMQESVLCDHFTCLMENFENLVKLDNVIAVTNIHSHNTTYLLEHSTGWYVINQNGIAHKSARLSEALQSFNTYSGTRLNEAQLHVKLNEEQEVIDSVNKQRDNLKQEAEKYQQIIDQCNEEQKFCEKDSPRYQEFESIKQDAEEARKILNQTIDQLK